MSNVGAEITYLVLEMDMLMSALTFRILQVIVQQDICYDQFDLDISQESSRAGCPAVTPAKHVLADANVVMFAILLSFLLAQLEEPESVKLASVFVKLFVTMDGKGWKLELCALPNKGTVGEYCILRCISLKSSCKMLAAISPCLFSICGIYLDWGSSDDGPLE